MALLDDIVSRLETQDITGSGTDWTAYASYLPDSPDRAIAVYETGGVQPNDTDGTPTYEFPTFQVRIRGVKFGYSEARTQAQAVYDALHDATITNYIYIFATNSGVIPLGYDTNERPEMVINFATMKKQ